MEIPCLGLHSLALMEYLQDDKTIIDKNLVIHSSAFLYISIYLLGPLGSFWTIHCRWWRFYHAELMYM